MNESSSKKKKNPFDYVEKGDESQNNESKQNPFSLKDLDPD
jgi:hypothetical protein